MSELFIVKNAREEKRIITVKLTKAVISELDVIAQRLHWSRTELMIAALEFALDRIDILD